LNKDVKHDYIPDQVRDLCSKGKQKWEEGQYRPLKCSQVAWKTLVEHFNTKMVMEEVKKMKKMWGAMKNPSHVGQGGKK